MMVFFFFILTLLCGGTLSQQDNCLCVTNAGNITVRESPCGTPYKEHSVGACFQPTGSIEECLLDGMLQEFIQINYGAERLYWIPNINVDVSDRARCAGNGGNCNNSMFVSRAEWGARDPVTQTPIESPLSGAFVHHSAMSHCYDKQSCIDAVKEIQDLHMDTNGWDDLGYHFLIGEDGRVYEGRGWNNRGAHARQHNAWSYGMCVMGNFMQDMPLEIAIQAVKDAMNCGVVLGHLTAGFEVFGHRDGVCTACPGDRFYPEVQTWPYYSHREIPVYC